MTQHDDKTFLLHILDAIAKIESYTTGVAYEQFAQSNLIQDAVVRQLTIIGEASNNLTDGIRASHPEVPWRRIIGMRNRIIHAYFSVDLLAVWDTIESDLSQLKEYMARMLTQI